MATTARTREKDDQVIRELFDQLGSGEVNRRELVATLAQRLADQPHEVEHRLRKVRNLIGSPHFDQALTELIAAVDGSGGTAAEPADDEVAEATRDELYELAREADIPGRSRMTKDELSKALHRKK